MDVRRLHLLAALLLYLSWVATLGIMAASSGHHPPQRPSLSVPR